MYVLDALLFIAMMFFLFLPITDRKTARMKLCALCAILAIFAVSVTTTSGPDIRLASLARDR
jgi:hypothetical protein